MKNQAEIYQALLDGKALICISNIQARLDASGDLYSPNVDPKDIQFNEPEDWQIYEPPKWYDNIPEGGVLCCVTGGGIGIIRGYEGNRFYENSTKDDAFWTKATPLTKEEIQVFMDNTPEENQ